MRIPSVLCLCLLSIVMAACASQEEPRDRDMDFFERISKSQEKRESERRDADIARSKGLKPKSGGDGTLAYYERAKDAKARSEPIRITWEGLAREREIADNSKYKRRGSLTAPMKITLVSESHPDAPGIRTGRTKKGREASSHSTVLRDADLVRFIQGLERRGFYKHARSTDAQAGNFEHPRARGRVTIERSGQSVTLLSMRGQGQDPRTKAIPGIYSESKQAIMELRNRTPGLSLTSVETDSLLPGFGR